MLLEPDKNPLSLLANLLSRESVHNPDFDVIEDELVPTLVTSAETDAAPVTDITLSAGEGAYVPVRAILVNQQTGESFSVDSKAGDVLTVTESWGGTAAAGITSGDTFVVMPVAETEGSSSESSITTVETQGTNYTQIMRWPFDVTGTENASKLYGGGDLGYQGRKAGIEFHKRMDLAFFFNEKNLDSAAKRRSTGGLNEFITSYRQDMGATFNLTTFYNFAEDFFRYGSKDKVAFISRGIGTQIAIQADSKVERVESAKSIGMHVTRLESPHGRLRLINHDSLEGPIFGGYGFIVDPENIGYRYLEGRDVMVKTNIQAPGDDVFKNEVFAEVGLFRSLEKTHAVMTNGA